MSKETKILNSKGKVVLIVCISILALILVGVLFYNFKLNNDTNKQQGKDDTIVNNADNNPNEKELGFKIYSGDKQSKEELNLNGLKVNKFKLIKQEGSILIKGEIENPTDSEFENKELLFELYNSNGNKVVDYQMIISEKIEPKEIRKIETVIGLESDDITDINVKIIDSENM